jgi:hypothetical protein
MISKAPWYPCTCSSTMVRTLVPLVRVHVYLPWCHWYSYHGTYTRTMYATRVRTYDNVMSQLSDWKRALRTTCVLGGYGSQLRVGANAGQHTPTLSLPPSHHCLNGEVYRGNRRVRAYVRTYYNVMSQLSDWKRAHMCTENHVCTRVPGTTPW